MPVFLPLSPQCKTVSQAYGPISRDVTEHTALAGLAALSMDHHTLVVFGDQSTNVSSHLRALLLDVPRSATQSNFIRETGRAIQRQLHQLSHARRSHLADFSNVHQMARVYEEAGGECHPAITGALVCITQLLQLFRHFETRPVAQDRGCVSTLGLCTGSLAAVAYAASNSSEDLSRLAVPAVLIAFQVGIYAADTSSSLYEQRQRLQSWSIAIPMFTEQEAITVLSESEADHNSTIRPSCYVSAVSPNSVTISGTPVALEALSAKLVARAPNAATWKMPIFAAFHAAHLYTSLDTSSLLASSGVDLSLLATSSLVHNFISSATGEDVQASSALDLFHTAVKDILQLPLRMDRVVERYAALIDRNGSILASVTPVEPCPGQQQLVDRIQSLTQARVRKDCFSPVFPSLGQREESGDDDSQPLAIVGMSCRLPGDVSCAEDLWDVLCKQGDMHRTIPPDRFDISSHVDSTGKAKNTSYTPYGCFIDRPGEFDPRFFKMSPKEASQTCPMQRLALVTAYEALEHAGFVPDRTPSTASHRVGTFFGQTSDDYRDTNSSQAIGTHFITGGIRAFGPGRINHILKFSGPSYCVDTACSSSLAAIQLACTAIWNDECDTAIAGGLSVLTSPDLYSGLSRGQFLSKTGSCKTFDDSADGYCRADGIGTIIIKRLSDALQDRDNVLATILAAATNHSAHAISITHPHAPTQLRLYRQVLDQAGVDPRSIGYVEMHGTGTQAGDKCEMESVTKCFSPSAIPRAIDNPLYIGSVKGNLGHSEAASGVTSLLKAMLILQKSQIPPHVGIQKNLNRGFPDLESLNVHIPRALTPLTARAGVKKTVLVNNFSAAGGNTALLLQESPPPATPSVNGRPSRPVYAVAISGHTSTALSNNLDRMITHLSEKRDIALQDLSYTTTARRKQHTERVTVVGDSMRQVMDRLRHRRALPCNKLQPVRAKKIVFVFTCQGSAYCHLAQQLYDTSARFRLDIDAFNSLAESHGFPSFLGMINGTVTQMSDLSPAQSQIGMFSVQVALARMWAALGIHAAAVLGHSLGEYAALAIAGVLSINDALFLVGKRAQLLESRCTKDTHAMLAVTGSQSPLQLALDTNTNVACLNSPKGTVFAGTKSDIDQLQLSLEREGGRPTRLSLPYAFHSAQVDPILDDLQEFARGVCLGKSDMSIMSPTYGRTLLATDQVDARYFAKHCRDTVKFGDALQDAQEREIVDENTIFLEIGPDPVCCGMIRATLGEQAITLPSLRRAEDPWVTMTTSLAALHDARLDIDWAEYQRDLDIGCRLVDLPPYAFDNDNHWIPYENEWTLRKGEAAPSQNQKSTLDRETTPNRISASVHRLLREDRTGSNPTFEFETDLSYYAVHAVASGHRVNGSCLCPSSLYADIALTIAQYLDPSLVGDIRDMEVTQPLLVDPKPEREKKTLRVTACLQQDKQYATLKFFSYICPRQAPTQHAICCIEFDDSAKWSQQWAHDLHFVDERIGTLQRDIHSGAVNSIQKDVAYRLFAELVDYAPDFRRMTRVWLDSPKLEASAVVSQQVSESDKGFCFSPYHLDALLHLSGFIMNAKQAIEQTGAVYISHGWRSLRLSKSLVHDEECTTYVKMISVDKTMVSGNVYMIQRGSIVGVCEGVRFQQVRRAVLNLLLPPSDDGVEKQRRIIEPSPSVIKQNTSMEVKRTRPSVTSGPIPSASLDTGLTASFFDIISDETGVQRHSLTFESHLDDLGIDSLMSLAIAGRLKEKCGLDIDHAHILHCQTLHHLWDSFSPSLTDNDSSDEDGIEEASTVSGETSETGKSGTETPASDLDNSDHDIQQLVSSTMSEEIGLQVDTIPVSSRLSDFGLDSLMGLAILGKLQEAGMDVKSDFFLLHDTMEKVYSALAVDTRVTSSLNLGAAKKNRLPAPDCADRINCILLQQNQARRLPRDTLFLLPDGSGSPYSYAPLKTIGSDVDVYGLTCPFIKDPSAFTCGIEGVAALYSEAILSKPFGRLHLGGWSAGGVLAFEIARQLAAQHGQEITSLILIDAPCPTVLPPMHTQLVEFLDSLALFNSNGAEQKRNPSNHRRMLEHFDATTKALAAYKPAPLKSPLVALIVWARDGVLDRSMSSKTIGISDDPVSRWILDKRHNLQAHGWDQLLPSARVQVVTVPGNHFTLMQGNNINAVSRGMQRHFSLLADTSSSRDEVAASN